MGLGGASQDDDLMELAVRPTIEVSHGYHVITGVFGLHLRAIAAIQKKADISGAITRAIRNAKVRLDGCSERGKRTPAKRYNQMYHFGCFVRD